MDLNSQFDNVGYHHQKETVSTNFTLFVSRDLHYKTFYGRNEFRIVISKSVLFRLSLPPWGRSHKAILE